VLFWSIIADDLPMIWAPFICVLQGSKVVEGSLFPDLFVTPPAMAVRILIADDHTLVNEATEEFLRSAAKDYAIIGKARDAADTLTLAARHRPDLLLLDYGMPGLKRFSEFCAEVHRVSPKTDILLLTGREDEEAAFEAAIGGAKAYITKRSSFSELVAAIDTVLRGGTWVDPLLPPQAHRTFLEHRGEKGSRLRRLSRQE